MKNQYFGDDRDFCKYELLIDLALCLPGMRLVSIPMLTPNDGTGEGGLTLLRSASRRPQLASALRQAVDDGKRDIASLRAVMPMFGVTFLPYRDTDQSWMADRVAYFSAVPAEWLSDSVVFLDPDIGLQTGTSSYMRKMGTEKYLFDSDLRLLAAQAFDRSVFVVYQHLQKDARKRPADLKKRMRQAGENLHTSANWAVQFTDLAFLVSVGNQLDAATVRDALAQHAIRHGGVLWDP